MSEAVQTVIITETASGFLQETNYNLKLKEVCSKEVLEDHLICVATRRNERGREKKEKIRSISLSVRK